jgi:rhodanese-related sulfurtransferase
MIPQLRPAQLSAWFVANQSQGQPVLLDVREPHELVAASLPPDASFELIAIPMNSVPARVSELDTRRAVAVLCHHGARSQRVAQFLQSQGFAQVVNIAGGIDAWATEVDVRVARY